MQVMLQRPECDKFDNDGKVVYVPTDRRADLNCKRPHSPPKAPSATDTDEPNAKKQKTEANAAVAPSAKETALSLPINQMGSPSASASATATTTGKGENQIVRLVYHLKFTDRQFTDRDFGPVSRMNVAAMTLDPQNVHLLRTHVEICEDGKTEMTQSSCDSLQKDLEKTVQELQKTTERGVGSNQSRTE